MNKTINEKLKFCQKKPLGVFLHVFKTKSKSFEIENIKIQILKSFPNVKTR